MGGQFSPLGTLALFDPVLASPQRDWPPKTLVTGAAMHDAAAAESEPEAMQAKLEDFLTSGPPPLVFALGSSAVWLAQDFWKHAIAACQRLGYRGLLLTGMPLQQPLPATIAAFEYLPYSSVFARAAAVIHQAGIGTLSQALRSGRPQLLTPVGFDQPDNAARAARLGLGRVLPFHRAYSGTRLVRELRVLLDDPAYERAAGAMADRLRGIDGAAAAAERILSS
jgi:UDP:flavonoid glycosyltransferase YjiC (YdhE family)